MISVEKKLQSFLKVADVLNLNNISWAVGASLLLYFKGITKTFNDIDIMISVKDVHKTKNILLQFGKLNVTSINPYYNSKGFMEFIIDDIDFDIMSEFKVINEKTSKTFPFDKSYINDFTEIEGVSIPLQSVKYWLEFYEFTNRIEKVEMINAYLNK